MRALAVSSIVIVAAISACKMGQQTERTMQRSSPDFAVYNAETVSKTPRELEQLLLLLKNQEGALTSGKKLSILSPYDNTVFPPEIAAVTFHWKNDNPQDGSWLLRFEFQERQAPVYDISRQCSWRPSKALWEKIKQDCSGGPVRLAVFGYSGGKVPKLHSKDTIRFLFSKDRVDAPVFFRQVPLPFRKGEKYLKEIKWCLGDISSYQSPVVVMKNLSMCAGCHTASKDGAVLSMEMDYRNDRGAQFVTKIRPEIRLEAKDFMSWNNFPRPEILPKTRGLFARISPSGRFIVSTVHEIVFMALTNDPAFSRLFFPTHGILGWYDVGSGIFHRLPGADDHQVIQTAPEWHPDERFILFSRAETRNEYHEDIDNIKVLEKDKGIEALNKAFPIKFDIYRMAFNGGTGGTPEPLAGASLNGMSNYFPRYSPDKKWIVFTQSPAGIMLQPDSRLYILPAGGGRARKMRCNRGRFNSWHSWSPNGKWLLFSSKADSIYTDIFLTHIDKEGNDSPPVRLERFSESFFAANVPEFISISPRGIRKIVTPAP